MENRIKLNFFELMIFHKIKKEYQNVIMLPVDLYASILLFCEQVEDYEMCLILKSIENKVVFKTVNQILDE